MFRPSFRARATLLAAVLGLLLSPAAWAADMPFPMDAPPPEGPVEWGSNWYLRGDLGVTRTSPYDLNGANGSSSMPNNWNVGLGFGYKFNDWLRADITADWQRLYRVNSNTAVTAPCYDGFTFDPAFPTWGYLHATTCTAVSRSRAETMAVMGNLYFDLGNWYGFTPYVGAGVGVNVLFQKDQLNFYLPNQLSATQTFVWDAGITPIYYYQNLDRRSNADYLRLAYSFMGGVAYDLTDHLKVDVGYRFLNLGKIDGVNRLGNTVTTEIRSHQIRAGFRYMID